MPRSVHTKAYKLLVRCLVEARHDAGITQQELALKLRRPQSFVAKYEAAERRLDLVEVLQVTRALAADPQAIVAAVAAAL